MTVTDKMRRQVLENISDANTGYTTIADILWNRFITNQHV